MLTKLATWGQETSRTEWGNKFLPQAQGALCSYHKPKQDLYQLIDLNTFDGFKPAAIIICLKTQIVPILANGYDFKFILLYYFNITHTQIYLSIFRYPPGGLPRWH